MVICFIISITVSIALYSANAEQTKKLIEQDKIIANQATYQFELEGAMNIQDQIIQDQELIMEVYEDIIDLHNLMQEVE